MRLLDTPELVTELLADPGLALTVQRTRDRIVLTGERTTITITTGCGEPWVTVEHQLPTPVDGRSTYRAQFTWATLYELVMAAVRAAPGDAYPDDQPPDGRPARRAHGTAPHPAPAAPPSAPDTTA